MVGGARSDSDESDEMHYYAVLIQNMVRSRTRTSTAVWCGFKRHLLGVYVSVCDLLAAFSIRRALTVSPDHESKERWESRRDRNDRHPRRSITNLLLVR